MNQHQSKHNQVRALLTDALAGSPSIEAILEMCSRSRSEDYQPSDVDLFVILNDGPPKCSLVHFHVDDFPVDIHLRDLGYVRVTKILSGFDVNLKSAHTLYDRRGEVEALISCMTVDDSLPALTEQRASRLKHRHASLLRKASVRAETDTEFSNLILSIHLAKLLDAFWEINGLQNYGETATLNHLKEEQPLLYQNMVLASGSSSLSERLMAAHKAAELVFSPLGGITRTIGLAKSEDVVATIEHILSNSSVLRVSILAELVLQRVPSFAKHSS